jgi:hypothetical protein
MGEAGFPRTTVSLRHVNLGHGTQDDHVSGDTSQSEGMAASHDCEEFKSVEKSGWSTDTSHVIACSYCHLSQP